MVADQEVVTKLTELDMMVADLEHANTRVATVERRNVSRSQSHWSTAISYAVQELLRAEIEAIRSGKGTPDRLLFLTGCSAIQF